MEELNDHSPAAPDAALSELDSLRVQPLGFVVLTLVGIFFLYQIIGGGLTLLLFGRSITAENVQWMRLSTVLAQILFLLAPTLYLIRAQHGKIGNVLPRRIPKASEAVLAIAAVFSLQQVMEGYLYFQDKIPLPESLRPFIEAIRKAIEETYRLLVEAHSTPELLFVIIVVALTPAICEELLFRGLIQKNLVLGTNRKAGFILTGVVFGLYHLNPFLVVPLVGLGVLFGYLMHRSGTILVPMIAHFINNLVSVLGVYYEGNTKDSAALSMFNSLEDFSATFVITALIGFGLVFVISIYFYRQVTSRFQPGESGEVAS